MFTLLQVILLLAVGCLSLPSSTLRTRQSRPPNGETVLFNNGTLQCYSSQNTVDPDFYMAEEDASAAIDDFCSHATGAFGPTSKLTVQARRYAPQNPQQSQSDHLIDVSAMWVGGRACDSFNFTSQQPLCKQQLNTTITNCDQTKTTNNPYWKQGGTFTDDCIVWQVAVDSYTLSDMFGYSVLLKPHVS